MVWLRLISLVTLSSWFLAMRTKAWDLPYYDGALYFAAAKLWPHASLLDRDWSPLYVAMYSIFQKVIGSADPWLVYASHRFLILLISVALFWRIAERLLAPGPAMVAALALLGNEGLLESFHVVHAFALLYVLVVLNVAAAAEKWSSVLVALSLAGMAVRPEFVLATVILVPVVVYGWVQGAIPRPSRGTCGLALLILVFAASIWLLAAKGAGRAFVAFSQQSAWAFRDSEGGGESADHFYHIERTRRIYGDVDSIPGAMRSNPAEFLRHVKRNLVALPKVLVATVVPTRTYTLACVFLLALTAAAIVGGRGRGASSVFWVSAASYAVGVVVTSLIFRPDVLYLLPAAPLLLLGGCWILAAMNNRYVWRRRGALQLVLVGAAAAVVFVSVARGVYPGERPVATFAKILGRDYSTLTPKRIHAFSSVSYCVFSGGWSAEVCAPIEPDPQWGGSLRDFLEAKDVNVLVWGTQLEAFYASKRASDHVAFEEEMRLLGFRRIEARFGLFRGETLYVREAHRRE